MTTTIYWPPNLPHEQFLDLVVTPADARLQTSMEVGAPKVRLRSFKAVVTATVPSIFTGAQVKYFDDTFWTVTLEGGVKRFLWRHPVTGLVVEFGFANRPAWRPFVAHEVPDLRKYRTELPLRIHT
jgi:hypothetical protein